MTHSDRRSELRLEEQATVFVEVCSADFEDGQSANIVICNSLDISANGIQVKMDQRIPEGSILRLCAQFHDHRDPIYVVGEVKWVHPDNDEYCIGFGLFESDQTDIVAWKEFIANKFLGDGEQE